MSDATNQRLHRAVFDTLPWYSNGTLSEAESVRVESHLNACRECMDELRRCTALTELLSSNPEYDRSRDAWNRDSDGLERIWARVDTPVRANSSVRTPSRAAPRWRSRWWRRTPVQARLVLAAQAVVAAGLLVLLLGPGSGARTASGPSGADLYETLTRGPAPMGGEAELARPKGPRSGVTQLQVVFDESIELKSLRGLLQRVGASIASGPSEHGIYRLLLPAGASVERVLEVLRSDPAIRFADCVDVECS